MTSLKRLLGPKPDVPASVAEACAELERLGQQQPLLKGHARALHAAVILFAHPVREPAWTLPAERVTDKWTAGVALLRGENPPLDEQAFAQRWLSLCEVVDAADELARAIRNRTLLPAEMTNWILSGQTDVLHGYVEYKRLDAALAASILRWTLFPWLVHLQINLASSLPPDRWPHGYCPICGSWPALGEFRGLENRCACSAAACARRAGSFRDYAVRFAPRTIIANSAISIKKVRKAKSASPPAMFAAAI